MQLGEKLDGAWTEHGNVVFVANLFANGDTEKRAPSPTQHDFIFQAGPGVGQPRPYTISKDDLAEVQFIVFAIYNIDAVGEVRYMCVSPICAFVFCVVLERPFSWMLLKHQKCACHYVIGLPVRGPNCCMCVRTSDHQIA